MKVLFKHYTTLCGLVEIEADNEDQAMQKFKTCKLNDLEWRADPNRQDRTTYEIVCKDPPVLKE